MVHRNVVALAERLGAPLSYDRHARGSYIYDGATIAVKRDDDFLYTDHEVIHEIFHWLLAWPEQRCVADYAFHSIDPLAIGEHQSAYAAANVHFCENRDGFKDGDGRTFYLTAVESIEQELSTQLMCAVIGPRLEIDAEIRNFDGNGRPKRIETSMTWSTYATKLTRRLSPLCDNNTDSCVDAWTSSFIVDSDVRDLPSTELSFLRHNNLFFDLEKTSHKASMLLAHNVGARAMHVLVEYCDALQLR